MGVLILEIAVWKCPYRCATSFVFLYCSIFHCAPLSVFHHCGFRWACPLFLFRLHRGTTMTPNETVSFIDNFVNANMSYLNNITYARLEFLSLWLQSHPDTSTMDEEDREALCLLITSLADCSLYTDEARTFWRQIANDLKSYSFHTAQSGALSAAL